MGQQDDAKRNAAAAALDFVQEGMIVGLGSGSTAAFFVQMLGERITRTGLTVRCLPTSEMTAAIARESGVPLIPIDQADRIDVTIDGADEIDPEFRLIKGGGGCHLREKLIAHASDQLVIIGDESKMVDELGAFPLPVEVDPFGFTITAKKVYDALRETGCARKDVDLRRNADGTPYITDGNHYILDCRCERIPEPERTARALARIPGVMEHGLFIGLADVVIIGVDDGADIYERDEA